jgi:hypothetical protein
VITKVIVSTTIRLYGLFLTLYPADFRHIFGDEMRGVLQELLAQQTAKGVWAVFLVSWREFYQLPPALWRAHLAARGKKYVRQTVFQFVTQSPFHSVPPANDGRFSWRQTLLEIHLFVVVGVFLCVSVYWVSAGWQRQWLGIGWIVLLLALPTFLLGLARGLPRWAYPAGGLLLGYSLLVTQRHNLAYFWVCTLLASFFLALTAVHMHIRNQPLSPFLQRLGQSMNVDWTRLCFGLYGMMPCLLITAFDGAYRNDRTPYLAFSLLLMILGALFYGRSRRQERQFWILMGSVPITLIPPFLHQANFQGGPANAGWIGVLWAFMITLLLLPVLARLIYQTWTVGNATAANGERL